jgi:hypothetical protein
MGKVVTSQGLTEFVQSGKVTHVTDHKDQKKGEAAPLEVKADTPASDLGKTAEKPKAPEPQAAEAPAPETPDSLEDDGLTDEERRDLSERIRKIIGKKHRAMKEAQEANQDADRFAENQYNERRLAEQRAEAAERKALEMDTELKKLQLPAQAPEAKAPNISDFKDPQTGQIDWDKFTDAKAEFAANKAVADERARQAEETAARARAEAEKQVKERIDAVRKAHPDFDDVLASIKGSAADQVPQFVLNYLFESDNGGELHYYLMKHPEESIRISKLTPIRGIAEMGKLEDKIGAKPSSATPSTNGSTPKEAPRGGAPAPITPLSGEGQSGGINTDPAKMSYKELRAYERARVRNKH